MNSPDFFFLSFNKNDKRKHSSKQDRAHETNPPFSHSGCSHQDISVVCALPWVRRASGVRVHDLEASYLTYTFQTGLGAWILSSFSFLCFEVTDNKFYVLKFSKYYQSA